MTTSSILAKTAGKIIEQALRDARIVAVEQPIQDIDNQRGLDALNNVAKYWQTQDINLWLEDQGVLPLIVGQARYLLGPNGAESANADDFFNTTLGAAQVAADTAITVASSTNMTAAPNILSTDPTTSVQDWTAINSATLAVSSGLLITNVSSTAGGADYTLPVTVGQTYRVRFGFTLGTSSSCAFSVLNGATVADTTTLTASSASTELTITAVNSTITFRAQNVSTTTGHTGTVASLQYVDDQTGSRIGFELTDGSRYWDYVLNVNSATSIDITTGLLTAASSGLTVFFYLTKLERPMRLLRKGCTYSDSITGSEIPVNRWARSQYLEQPDKNSTGTINQFTYRPRLNDGELFIWQVAGSVNNIFRFNYVRPAKVYTETTDELDFPSEFYLCLKWAIAADIGPSYGLSDSQQMILESKAASTLENTLAHDTEMDAMILQPDFS
jgi:hypothetical protein